MTRAVIFTLLYMQRPWGTDSWLRFEFGFHVADSRHRGPSCYWTKGSCPCVPCVPCAPEISTCVPPRSWDNLAHSRAKVFVFLSWGTMEGLWAGAAVCVLGSGNRVVWRSESRFQNKGKQSRIWALSFWATAYLKLIIKLISIVLEFSSGEPGFSLLTHEWCVIYGTFRAATND